MNNSKTCRIIVADIYIAAARCFKDLYNDCWETHLPGRQPTHARNAQTVPATVVKIHCPHLCKSLNTLPGSYLLLRGAAGTVKGFVGSA
jgi:hypothetical protein